MKKLTFFALVFQFDLVFASPSGWVKEFVRSSDGIQAARESSYSAEQLRKQAKSRFFPSVYLEGTYRKQKVPVALGGSSPFFPNKTFDAGVVVEQPVFLGGRIWAGVSQRRILAKIEKQKLRQEKNDQISAFLDLLFEREKASRQRIVIAESSERLKAFVRSTQKKVRLGNAKSFELSQSIANQHSYLPRLESLKTQEKVLLSQVLSLVENPPSKMESSLLSLDEVKIKIKVLESREAKIHPQLIQAEESVELAKSNKNLELGEHYPSLSLRGKWGYRAVDRETLFESESKASELSVAVTIPLFSGLSSVYTRRSKTAEIYAAERKKILAKKNLLVQQTSQRDQLKNLLVQAKHIDKWRVNAQKALSLGLKSYRLGVIDNFQVVNLQQAKEQAETAFVDLLFVLNKTLKSWAIASGEDLEYFYTDENSDNW